MTPTPPERAWRIDDLVWRHAARDSSAPAVIDGTTTLTYGELTAAADRVAGRLSAAGVGRDRPVALLVERSAEFLVGLLGILRAGGACLPLSPSDPRDRVTGLLAGVRPVAVLTRGRYRSLLDGVSVGTIVEVDGDHPDPDPWAGTRGEAAPTDLAFVIATSGSTGKPKAVRITHANYTSQIGWIAHNFGLRAADRTLFKAPVSFVSMLRQVIWPLAAGASLIVVPPGGEVDVPAMCRLIDDHQITWTTFISPALATFLRHARLDGGSLRNVVSGGDRFPPGTARDFFRTFPAARLHHTYGLSEAIVVSCARLDGPDADEATMGTILPGGTALVLDDQLRPVAVGGIGELYVGGVALTPGYLGDDALNAQRFVERPELAAGRLFATRDRANVRADGSFELAGRADNMVKIRGFRIELGEVEQALSRHPGIAQCICLPEAADGGDSRLIACLVPTGTQRPAGPEIRAFLRTAVPDYMVPARYVWFDAIPLTANGKVDRERLLAVAAEQAQPEGAPATDHGPVAQRVRSAWVAVLRDGSPGHDDDFFGAGGTSLNAMDLAARLTDEFEHDVPVTLILDHPTLSGLIAAVGRELDAARQ